MKAGAILVGIASLLVLLALSAALRTVADSGVGTVILGIAVIAMACFLYGVRVVVRDVPTASAATTQQRILVVVAVVLLYAALSLRLLF